MYIIIFLLCVLFVGAVGFSVVYYFTAGKDEDSDWRHKEYSIPKKLLLALNVIVTIVSVYLTVFGFVDRTKGSFALVGVVLWVVTACISAYVCSPLRLAPIPEIQERLGWSQAVFYPLFAIMIPVSIVLTMLISWVFALIAIFKHTKIWFKLLIGILILSVALTPPAIMGYKELKEAKEYEIQTNIKEGIIKKIETAIDSGETEKIVLTEEETAYCVGELNTYSPFRIEGVNEILAEKFCKINNEKDADAFLTFMEFLVNNGVHITDEIYFEGGSFAFFRDTIIERSKKQYFDSRLNKNCYDFDFCKVSIDDLIAFMGVPNADGLSDTYVIMKTYYDNRYSADDFDLIIDKSVMTVKEYKNMPR